MRDATPFLCNNLPSPCLRYVIEGKGSDYFARHSLGVCTGITTRVSREHSNALERGKLASQCRANVWRKALQCLELGEECKAKGLRGHHAQRHGTVRCKLVDCINPTDAWRCKANAWRNTALDSHSQLHGKGTLRTHGEMRCSLLVFSSLLAFRLRPNASVRYCPFFILRAAGRSQRRTSVRSGPRHEPWR